MKKVLIWGLTENWGGIESVVFNYVSNSNKNEIQFDFITTFKSIPRSEKLTSLGCKIYFICSRRLNYLKYKCELNNFMKKHAVEYDAVWLNDCMFANIDILKLAKKYGIKKRIIHAHNSNYLGGGKSRAIRHKINSLFLTKYATDYWACSQLAGEWSYSKKVLKSSNYRVINNAIDCKEYSFDPTKRNKIRMSLGINDKKFVIGHVGRFDYQKNHHYLLQIMKAICSKEDDVILLSVGTGTDWELIKFQAENLNLSDKIIFLGQRSDIADLFQAMDIFVLPSRFEGLPVVLVEALAAGLPCIISNRITKEAGIIPELCKFESIDSSVYNWVNDIDEIRKNNKRKNTFESMKLLGYDIKTQASEFHKLF